MKVSTQLGNTTGYEGFNAACRIAYYIIKTIALF